MHSESSESTTERKPQPEHEHPDEWHDDLDPNHMALQNRLIDEEKPGQ